MKRQPVVPVATCPEDGSAPSSVFVMARFRRLMFVQGWSVDLARLCVDPPYMYECLARAHQCGEEQLRRVAMVLFAGAGVGAGANGLALAH
jgi:hypothetical protein